jgi:hypothetical protein
VAGVHACEIPPPLAAGAGPPQREGPPIGRRHLLPARSAGQGAPAGAGVRHGPAQGVGAVCQVILHLTNCTRKRKGYTQVANPALEGAVQKVSPLG